MGRGCGSKAPVSPHPDSVSFQLPPLLRAASSDSTCIVPAMAAPAANAHGGRGLVFCRCHGAPPMGCETQGWTLEVQQQQRRTKASEPTVRSAIPVAMKRPAYPSVSVVIPTFNRVALISETIQNMLGQSCRPAEIVVVDDGSTDGTADAVARFGADVRLLRQRNRGPAAARNAGLAVAKGDYVQFMDSDDLALSNKLEVQVRALEESGADIAYGPWLRTAIRGSEIVPENLVFQQHGLPDQSRSLAEWLLTYWSVIPHTCVFRRSLIERVGGFPEELFGIEDQEFFRRCLLAGARVVHTPDTLTLYRVGDHNKITSEFNPRALQHKLDWVRFILGSIDDPRGGPNPIGWFGFRCRLWKACEDLQAIEKRAAQELRRQAMQALHGHGPLVAYRLANLLQRWRGGVQVRMTGGRAHPCFRIGQLTAIQRELLERDGYRLAP